MNITLSIDKQVADQARKTAQAMRKSLNQAVRDHLAQLAGGPQLEAEDAEKLPVEDVRGLDRGPLLRQPLPGAAAAALVEVAEGLDDEGEHVLEVEAVLRPAADRGVDAVAGALDVVAGEHGGAGEQAGPDLAVDVAGVLGLAQPGVRARGELADVAHHHQGAVGRHLGDRDLPGRAGAALVEEGQAGLEQLQGLRPAAEGELGDAGDDVGEGDEVRVGEVVGELAGLAPRTGPAP